jgi:hypothetical protein
VDAVFTPSGQNDDAWFMAGSVSNDVFQVVNSIDPTLLRSCTPASKWSCRTTFPRVATCL